MSNQNNETRLVLLTRLREAKVAYRSALYASEQAWRKQAADVDVHYEALERGEINAEECSRRCEADVRHCEELSRATANRYDELQEVYGEFQVVGLLPFPTHIDGSVYIIEEGWRQIYERLKNTPSTQIKGQPK